MSVTRATRGVSPRLVHWLLIGASVLYCSAPVVAQAPQESQLEAVADAPTSSQTSKKPRPSRKLQTPVQLLPLRQRPTIPRATNPSAFSGLFPITAPSEPTPSFLRSQ